MTPPGVLKVCRECQKRLHGLCIFGYPTADTVNSAYTAPCAALELLQTISAQSPSDCRSEEMCLLAERLKKEVG